MANEINNKIKTIRNTKFENSSVFDQIKVIELKKKALLDIQSNIDKEIENIISKANKNISDKKEEIYNKPYRRAELYNGKPVQKAIQNRDKKFNKAKEEIEDNRDNDIKKIEEKVTEQICTLLIELEEDAEKFTSKNISTLSNDLTVSYGPYNANKMGWDLYITVKSDDVIILQTSSFLSFKDVTGIDAEESMNKDYDAYLNDVDFYDSLFLRGEPLFIYDLRYKVSSMGISNPSKYEFEFSGFTLYETKTLVNNRGFLSSSNEKNLRLNDTVVPRQMKPIYNMNGFSKYSSKVAYWKNMFEERRLAEKRRLAEEKRLAEERRIAEEKRLAEERRIAEEMKIAYEKRIEEEERIQNLKLNCRQKQNEIKNIILDNGYDGFNSVIRLPKGTDGSRGIEGDYVLFGLWPQSLKDDEVTINVNETKKINEWNCYKGSDNFYYVKQKAYPYGDDYLFANGEKIVKNKEYYFLLEPIKWRILVGDYQGGILLLSEVVLDTSYFNSEDGERRINLKKVYANNYEYSTIRAYLNGYNGTEYNVIDFTKRGFINKAFSESAINNIKTVNVDNRKESTGYNDYKLREVKKYICTNTNDKIFLLSQKEVTKFSARQRKPTEYAKATGIYVASEYEASNWWLRSPFYNYSNHERIVSYDGDVSNYSYVCNTDFGVVPALSISF